MPVTNLNPIKRPGRIASAFQDIFDAMSRWRLWVAFAWEDIRSTYHRTLFGMFWIAISFAVFVGVKLIIFAPMVGGDDGNYFGAYLLLGFFAWTYITMTVTTAPSVFIANESWIKNDPLPFMTYVFQAVARDFFNLTILLLTAISLYWLTDQTLDMHALLIFPALLLFVLNAMWVKIFLGIICTRYRDISQLVQTIMRAMMFLTPIFWMPPRMGELMNILWWNPFAHFVWILRTPVLDHQFATASWIYVGVVTVTGWVLALGCFILFRRRIPFWI